MKRPALKNFRRIVVKVGSSLLIDSDAGEVRSAWLSALAADIAKLHGEGRDVLVVSSGSIALGRSRLKLPRGPLKLEESQGAARWARSRWRGSGRKCSGRTASAPDRFW
jgi:glutamate 5-kinase